VEEYYRLNPEWRDRRRAGFFLDEIQFVPGWESFARRLLDSEQIDLFLSGSSARLLSREVATSMRGRAVEAVVYPFSFREHLRHHRREPDKAPGRLTKAQRSSLEKDLLGYLAASGYEVDFLARYPAGKAELIQVCASLDDPATRGREIRALLEAARQYPRARLHLVSLDIPPALDIPKKITVHAACDWLLQGNAKS